MFGTNDVKGKEKSPVTCVDGRMRIDCTRCPGPGSVKDRQCLICICDAVKDASELESVTIHSSTDTAFQGASLDFVRMMANAFSVLTMEAGDRRGGRCRGCRNSYRRITSDQIPMFPDIDIELLKNRALQCSSQSEVCDICLGDTVRLIDHLGTMIEDLTATVSPHGGE